MFRRAVQAVLVVMIPVLWAPLVVCSQELPECFTAEYSRTNQRWQTGEWHYGAARMLDSSYLVISQQRGGTWFLPAPPLYVDFTEDFDVEARMRWRGGRTTDGFGISWGSAGAYDHTMLLIRADGQYQLAQVRQRFYEAVSDWTPTDVLQKDSAWNTIVVQKRGTAVNIRINGYTIGSFEQPAVLGREFGVAVAGAVAVEYATFIVRQPQDPIRLAPNHPTQGTRENLGPNVNTTGGDLSPVITADGRFLYIGRYPYSGNIGNPSTEDIYVSEKQADGTWGKTQNVGRPLNNEGSNYLISITPDLNTVLVGNTYYPNGRPKGGGVSISFRESQGWSVPSDVRIADYYNRHRFAEMCLDPSGTRLIMAIERDDSRGEKDLYVSTRQRDGSFSVPVNLNSVNTWGNEMSPFVAADGETMYFATDGRKGYGGVDIWMTRRLDDTWLTWTEPENLGPVVNTADWDAYFTVPADGEFAYLSATNPDNNSADIYRIRLTEGVKPKPVVLVRGRVVDATTNQPIAAVVEYESLSKRIGMGQARSAPKDGSYAIALPAGDLYGFRATAGEAYYPISDQLSTQSLGSYTEITRDLKMVPVRKNEVIRLNNLFFDSGEHVLRPESLPELDRLVAFMKKSSTIVIELSGHTDNVGSSAANQRLSQDRVDSVREYLVQNGIDAKRLKAVGYGARKPLSTNSTEEGRQQNRRVEFKILTI